MKILARGVLTAALLLVAALAQATTFTVNSTNDIQLSKAGSAVTATGRLSLNQFQVIHGKDTSPPLDLRADYDVSFDRAANSAGVSGPNKVTTRIGVMEAK